MTSPKEWWRRAAAVAKDKRSLYLTLVAGPRLGLRNPDLEAAVIRATSHDDRSVDYKNSARVFSWARTSPSFLSPLMWALARRVDRTRSWPVALKSLLLAHGLLLISPLADDPRRLPFDLSDFRDRSSTSFSAFVRAYFEFLDHRSILLSTPDSADREIDRVSRLQALLDLLIQIRPYGHGMEVGLVLEAMDCVVIEIFEVYGGICNGIASFLVGVLGSSSTGGEEVEEERRRRGGKAIRVLRKAADQGTQLSSYFEVCRTLGVLNAREFPPVDRIPEEDIRDLEMLLMAGGISGSDGDDGNSEEKRGVEMEEGEKKGETATVVVTKDWVVFEDEFGSAAGGKAKQGHIGNPFVWPAAERQWASMVPNRIGNLIDL